MAVKIRLARMGAKRKPFYRFVAANTDAPRDGRYLEILGSYDPTKNPAVIQLHKEKVSLWLQKGATVSGSARAILKREGMLKGS
jgi:small subunit ribosomal protein S16